MGARHSRQRHSPSLTDTPLAEKLLNTPEKRAAAEKRHPMNKIASAEEIAALAVFYYHPKPDLSVVRCYLQMEGCHGSSFKCVGLKPNS